MRRSPRPAPPPARPLGGESRAPHWPSHPPRAPRAPPGRPPPQHHLGAPHLPSRSPHSFSTRPWDLPLRPRPFQASHRVIWDPVPLTPHRSLTRSPGAFACLPIYQNSSSPTSPPHPSYGAPIPSRARAPLTHRAVPEPVHPPLQFLFLPHRLCKLPPSPTPWAHGSHRSPPEVFIPSPILRAQPRNVQEKK